MADEPCTCGHSPEEHLDSPLVPGACDVHDCPCLSYEPDDPEEDD